MEDFRNYSLLPEFFMLVALACDWRWRLFECRLGTFDDGEWREASDGLCGGLLMLEL